MKNKGSLNFDDSVCLLGVYNKGIIEFFTNYGILVTDFVLVRPFCGMIQINIRNNNKKRGINNEESVT